MSEDLFSKIININNMEKAFSQTQRGSSKYDLEAMEFALNQTRNIYDLIKELEEETYKMGSYIRFKVFEPKERIIDAPHYKDKLVQIAINNVLKDIFNPCFIYDSYACIDNKGTHKAVERVSHFVRKANWEYGSEAQIIKIDIKKFFYTIDRDILKNILSNKIRKLISKEIKKELSHKIGCDKTLRLLFKIIDSANLIDLLGMPLGNTLSQICANVYMNLLDQFCKRKLSIKYYIRYADDIVIIVKNKEEAKRILNLVKSFIEKELNLRTNINKTKIFPINQGVNVVGFKIYSTHRLLRNDSKKKIKRKSNKMGQLILEGRMTVERAEQILNSWFGHAKNCCSYNFIKRLLFKNPYIYMSEENSLKININKIKKEGDLSVI